MKILGPIPEHIRRLMPKEDRKELGEVTNEEIIERNKEKNEKEMQESIVQYLNLLEIAFFRSRMDRKTSGTVGWPDFAFAINGKPCAVECKMPGEQLRPEQSELIKKMIRNGWQVCIAFSAAQAMEFINTLRNNSQ